MAFSDNFEAKTFCEKLEQDNKERIINSINRIRNIYRCFSHSRCNLTQEKIKEIKNSLSVSNVISEEIFRFIITYFNEKDMRELDTIILIRLQTELSANRNEWLKKSYKAVKTFSEVMLLNAKYANSFSR